MIEVKHLTKDQLKIYASLKSAKHRCTNRNYKAYHRYGGRGIKYLLEENKSRVEVVLEQWPAYMRAKRKHPNKVITINRIDNNGHYEDGNIEWVPMSENSKQMHRDNPEAYKKGLEAASIANTKPVMCITTGEKFESVVDAGRETGVHRESISACCLGKRYKSAGKTKDGRKLVWKYI